MNMRGTILYVKLDGKCRTESLMDVIGLLLRVMHVMSPVSLWEGHAIVQCLVG